MKLVLARKILTSESTIGELRIDGKYECLTLENGVRETKRNGETAIPYGTYKLKITKSRKLDRNMPKLVDVPEFPRTLIHWGDIEAEAKGSILVGQTSGRDVFCRNKMAFNTLFAKLSEAAAAKEDILIDIVRE
jgi:hypothetical protein